MHAASNARGAVDILGGATMGTTWSVKLVSRRGGEALANTDWAVISPAGDTIAESKGAFPRVILAEGEYKVIARNDNKVYQQDLTVIPGVDGEIEVLAR